MSLEWTVYLTAPRLLELGERPEGFERARDHITAAKFSRVIIEGYRGGGCPDDDLLQRAKDCFTSAGLTTLGGLMPVHGHGFGKRAEGVETRMGSFCYSDEETVAMLSDEVRRLAELFDQVVIDDAFLTSCRCARCNEARDGREWGAFRRDLLCSVAQRLVGAAREVNPDVYMTVKFPQYYERYHRFGYDAARFPEIFDRVWQGTETRDPATLDYGYVQPYEGYFNARWMAACAGERFEAAWFDFLDCDERQFVEQAITTCLAGPSHAAVFHYDGDAFETGPAGQLAERAEALSRLRNAAVSPVGAHVVMPPNADGGRDLFLFDYLGMLGIPCVPCTAMKTEMRSVILTAHAFSDPSLVSSAIPKALMAGRHVIATPGALLRMRDNVDLLEFFGYRPSGVAPGRAAVEEFSVRGKSVPVDAPVHVACDLEPVDACTLVSAHFRGCERGMLEVPFVTAKSFASGGRAVVWNIDTFGEEAFDIREQVNVPVEVDLLDLPEPVVDLLRWTATVGLGVRVTAPPRVGTFLFAKYAAFVNYGDHPASIELSGLPLDPSHAESDAADFTCTESALKLPGRAYALVKRAVAEDA